MPLVMPTARKSAVRIALVFALLIAVAGIEVAHHSKGAAKPLGEGPLIEFPTSPTPKLAVQQFLDGDFSLITDVKSLPRPVLQVFTEVGGSRLLMANPGKRFEATDVIRDATVPRKRLIFAGVLDDRCFVHYEQGGIAHMYILALFNLTSAEGAKPVWRGYCGPAANIHDLRSQVDSGKCSQADRF